MLLLMLPFFIEVTQPCDTEKDFSETEKLYKEGHFDQVLEKMERTESAKISKAIFLI